MRRTDKNPINENWIKEETLLQRKKNAKQVLSRCKEYEEQHKFIYVPHPTLSKTMIRKQVDK